MKRILGFTCIIAGLFMIAVGSYSGFELYNRYLINTSTFMFKGEYVNDSRIINIYDTKDENFTAFIDGFKYEFYYDGNIYKATNMDSNYLIKFVDDDLILYIYPQNEGILFKKIKTSN